MGKHFFFNDFGRYFIGFFFDLNKIKKLANKRIKADDKNIVENKKEVKEILLTENENENYEININNQEKDNNNEIKGEKLIDKKEHKNNNIEMNYINDN